MAMASDSFDSSGPPPRQGMSTGKRLLVFFAVGGGVLLLVCCGGGLWLYSKFKGAMSTDTEVVRAVSQEIADFDAPAGLSPAFSLKFGPMKMAAYQGGDVLLTLLEMDASTVHTSPEEMRRQMDEQLQKQGGKGHEITITERKTRELTVRGQAEEFLFARGTKQGSGEEFWQVSGAFPGKGGPAVLTFVAPVSQWDEDRIAQWIESIK
jgi:hypothetical protein